MKSLLVAAVGMLAVGAVTPAFAGPPPVYNWTGFYTGPSVGYGWAHVEGSASDTFYDMGVPISTTAALPFSFNGSGGVAGIQGGWNYQFPTNVVVGIEADGNLTSIGGQFTLCGSGFCTTTTTNVDDFSTIRGRLGYSYNNWLFYGTGGWAVGHSSSTAVLTPGPLTASSTANLSGWAAGGGIEWLVQPNWSVKLEYLHLQFDGVGSAFNFGTIGPYTLIGSGTANAGIDIVRVGVNFHFR